MVAFKKLLFAPLFLLSLAILVYLISPMLISTDFIFGLSADTLIQLITLAGLFLLTSIFFILFGAFSLNWRFTLPVIILASLTVFLFIPTSLAIVLSTLLLACFILSYTMLELKMKTYLTFQPTQIFSPSIKQLVGMLILIISIIYYFSINNEISQKGFQIPDSLIDTALQFAPPQTNQQENSQSEISLSQDQLKLLRSNPDLLKQSGIDPAILNAPKNLTNDLVKQTIKGQFQNMIKPYQSFIPAVLAVLLFITLQSITSMLSVFLNPLIWLIFLVLEKTGFVRFEKEMREVKKMVV